MGNVFAIYFCINITSKLSNLKQQNICYCIDFVSQEFVFIIVWYLYLKAFHKIAINMLAGSVVLSEGFTEGSPLPSSLV